MIKQVSVFCASSRQAHKTYYDMAYGFGKALASEGFSIIFGGGRIGLMGALSDGALSAGGYVKGVIPKQLFDLELGRNDIDELKVVSSMHDRENMLIMDCDAIVALPGGIGTFEELLQSIAWKQLEIINKPIIILNFNNYFDNLLKMLDVSISEGFMREEYKHLWSVVDKPAEVIDLLKTNPKGNTLLDFIPPSHLA